MLEALPSAYKALPPGGKGPSSSDAAAAVLGQDGDPKRYYATQQAKWQELFSWYRYLFLGRGKPSTHLRALSQVDDSTLAKNAPESISKLLSFVKQLLEVTQ